MGGGGFLWPREAAPICTFRILAQLEAAAPALAVDDVDVVWYNLLPWTARAAVEPVCEQVLVRLDVVKS